MPRGRTGALRLDVAEHRVGLKILDCGRLKHDHVTMAIGSGSAAVLAVNLKGRHAGHEPLVDPGPRDDLEPVGCGGHTAGSRFRNTQRWSTEPPRACLDLGLEAVGCRARYPGVLRAAMTFVTGTGKRRTNDTCKLSPSKGRKKSAAA